MRVKDLNMFKKIYQQVNSPIKNYCKIYKKPAEELNADQRFRTVIKEAG